MAYLDAIENVSKTVAGNSLVQQVTGPTRPYGTLIDYHNLSLPACGDQAQMSQHAPERGQDNKTVSSPSC